MLILVLAANTAYADFPRLASILARDRYLPRQFMNQGDRLAFSNGIVALSVFAGMLLVVFGGDTHALIPLYMIGVFVSFTLSQAGMVRPLAAAARAGLAFQRIVNGIGAMVTGVVLVVVAVTKAHEGAWIIMLLIPVLVIFFRATRAHYDHVAVATVAAEAGSRRRAATTPSSCRSAAFSARSSQALRLRAQPVGRRPRRIRRYGSRGDRAAEVASGRDGAKACRWWCSSRPIDR